MKEIKLAIIKRYVAAVLAAALVFTSADFNVLAVEERTESSAVEERAAAGSESEMENENPIQTGAFSSESFSKEDKKDADTDESAPSEEKTTEEKTTEAKTTEAETTEAKTTETETAAEDKAQAETQTNPSTESESEESSSSEEILQEGETPTSGECGANGANLRWSFENNTLTISGTGAMKNYDNSSSSQAPWRSLMTSNAQLIIGNGVTSIGNYAFYECWRFRGDLTIPNTVTEIGKNAFYGCSGFTGNLTIPDSVTSIGNYAFQGCSGFKGNLTIPNSVTKIGYYAFYNCKGFTGNLTIPDSITSIENYTFYGCSGFNGSLTIPGSIKEIRHNVFEGCSGFNGDLVIPSSITEIGGSAFKDCSGFNGDLVIPSSVTTIGGYVFQGCKGFNGNLTIPSSVTSIGPVAFEGCSGFKGDLIIPSSVTSIGGNAFQGCSGFTGNLTIPDSITYISISAFQACSGFNGNLVIPSSVTTIGSSAFRGCTGLTGDLTIPSSVRSIGRDAFSGCSSFNGKLTIPNSLTRIDYGTFSGCGSFTGDLTIPDSITYIGDYAFSGVRSTGSLTIPNSVTSIGKGTFSGVRFTGSLTIPGSVSSIGEGAFARCVFTGSLIIESGVKIIGDAWFGAFSGCEGITDVYLPGTVASIKEDEFAPYAKDILFHCVPNSPAYKWAVKKGYTVVEWNGITPQSDNDLTLSSVEYSYGNRIIDVMRESCRISKGQGKFKLTCKAKHPDKINGYALYVGSSKIADSGNGIFDNLRPADLQGGNLSVITKGATDGARTPILIKIVENELNISKTIDLGGDSASFDLQQDVPVVGKQKYEFDFPSLPVNAVLENGKLKIGINIMENKLSEYDSYEGNKPAEGAKYTWDLLKEFEEIEEEIKKDKAHADDILKDVRGYMQNGNISADIPMLEKAAEISAIGYAEAEWADSLKTLNGQLVIEIKASFDGQIQAAIGIIPFTFNVNFTASGQLMGTLGYDFEKTVWYGDAKLAFGIALEPYAGIGVGKWASAGIYGSADSGMEITLLSKDHEASPLGISKWDIYGEAGAKIYFAKLEEKIDLISTKDLKGGTLEEFLDDDGRLILYSSTENSVLNKKAESASEENANSISALNDMDYTNEISEWNEDSGATAYAAENAENVLIDNAYAAASPQTATIGNTTVFCYIDNDESRATPNQTVFKYRVRDNASKTWSEPKTALDDGTADFKPALYSDGNDIYAVYLNSSQTYNAGEKPSMKDYIGTFGVSVLKYDKDRQEFANLGKPDKNNVYCYLPQLAMTDKGLLAAWVENSDSHMFGLTENNRVMISIFKDGAFSEPVEIAGRLKSVTSLAIGKNGTDDSIAYTADSDNNLATANQEVYMATLSGSSPAPAKVAEGAVESLKFASLPGLSSPVLACSADGALAYIQGSGIKKLTEDGLIKGGDFTVHGNSVFFLQSQGGKRNVAAAACSNGAWNTVILTSETGYVDSFSYDGKLFTYLLTNAAKDATGEWKTDSVIKTLDSIGTGSAALYDASFDPADVNPGAEIPIKLSVRNEGINELTAVNVYIKKTDGTGNVQTLALDGKLAPGELKECTVNMKLPDSIGESCVYTASTKADFSGETIRLDMSKTDISVSASYVLERNETDIMASPVPKLEVTAYNISHVPAEGILTVKKQDGTIIYTSASETIAANDKKSYSIDLAKHLPADAGEVLFAAEFATDAAEYYKSNNTDEKIAYHIESAAIEFVTLPKDVAVSELNATGYEYTGSEIKPAIFVEHNGETLAEGTDYTLSYSNNVNLYNYNENDAGFDAGKAPKALIAFTTAVEVGGMSVTEVARYFKIVPKNISSSDVACPDIELYENGTEQKPDVNISANGKNLAKGTDYTLEYPSEGSNAYKAEGMYSIVVKGIGNYTGSRSVRLTITHVHSYGSYFSDASGHWRVCEKGEREDTAAHAYGDWTVIKEATETESGNKERTCAVCGYKNAEMIPAKGDGDVTGPDIPEGGKIPDGLWIANIDSAGYTYTGEAIIPQARVYDGNTLLTEKIDYTISLKNNVNAGTATITVTGRGSYYEKDTETFKINPANIGDCYAEEFYVKTGTKAQKPVPVIYYMGNKLKPGKDYTVSYPNDAGIYDKEAVYTVTVTGKDGGNYEGTKEIRLTAVDKIPKKTAASITKAKPEGFMGSLAYTGSEVKQECALKIGNETLAEGTHYTVRYSNNIKAGTATVTYYGKNGYSGKLKKTYKITPFDIEKNEGGKITLDKMPDPFYAKGGAKPKPVIKFDGKTLKECTDYTLGYKYNAAVTAAENKNGKEPCVIITGKGNFKGKATVNFKINQQDLANMELIPCDKAYKNRAGIYKITPKLIDLDGKALSAGKDFNKKIEYTYEEAADLEKGGTKNAGDKVADADIIPAGTRIHIKITYGTGGNYKGEFNGTYRIIKADIKAAKITIDKQPYQYKGKPIELDKADIKVTLSGDANPLDPEDFEIVKYANNVKKGTAQVTIRGKGENYGGTKTAAFKIGAKKFSWWKEKE